MPSARSRRFSSVNADEGEQPLVLPGLLDEVTRAALDAFDGQVDVAPRRHHDHRKPRIELLDAGQQIEAFPAGGGVARVIQVDQHHIVVALVQRLHQQLRQSHAVHIDRLRLEQQLNCLQNMRLVVGNQNPNFVSLTRDGPPP
jgi:transcriptional regulator CtsR